MKRSIAVFALLGIMVSSCLADDATGSDTRAKSTTTANATAVVRTYDELADLATVKTPEVKVTVGDRSVICQASYSYEGKKPRRPESVTFRLQTINEKQVWFEVYDAIWYKYDKKTGVGPAELLLNTLVSQNKPTVYTETLTAELPIDVFETIFSAKEVTVMLRGNPEIHNSKLRENYPLGKTGLAPFKELLQSIPKSSP